ncbi:hypothetical protein ACFY1J_29030 [Streptomyces sp. NPDC001406]|uniref:hypothetical protein n=1 Tax=Streptomyces sp. NPDC001406 TaxID=3364572 RepID=UPI00367E2FF0
MSPGTGFTGLPALPKTAEVAVVPVRQVCSGPSFQTPALLRVATRRPTSYDFTPAGLAIDALDAWGEDSSGLVGQQNPFLFCDSDLPHDGRSAWLTDPNTTEGYCEEPPL